jgi:hypothetical protein
LFVEKCRIDLRKNPFILQKAYNEIKLIILYKLVEKHYSLVTFWKESGKIMI